MTPEEIADEVKRVRRIRDQRSRALEAHELIRAMLDAVVDLSDERHFAVLELRDAPGGFPYSAVMALLGVDKSSAQAIIRGRRGLRRES